MRLNIGSRKKPQMTDVGQSGPPHMIETFAREQPGWLSRKLMAFISCELGE